MQGVCHSQRHAKEDSLMPPPVGGYQIGPSTSSLKLLHNRALVHGIKQKGKSIGPQGAVYLECFRLQASVLFLIRPNTLYWEHQDLAHVKY